MDTFFRSVMWSLGRHTGNALWDFGWVAVAVFFLLITLRRRR